MFLCVFFLLSCVSSTICFIYACRPCLETEEGANVLYLVLSLETEEGANVLSLVLSLETEEGASVLNLIISLETEEETNVLNPVISLERGRDKCFKSCNILRDR